MKRWFDVFFGALAVVVICSCGPARGESNDDNWTSADSEAETQGNRLFDQNQFGDAEASYREVLRRHPDSVTALMFHVKALDALERYPEAVAESKWAVGLDSTNSLAEEWLGISLTRSGQYSEAIAALEKSIALNADEETASEWLGGACFLDGQQSRADGIFKSLLQGPSREEQRRVMDQIANVFYQTGDGALAVEWWRRSAVLGSTDAARWLAWAYSVGVGVAQDEGDSGYWARRGDDPPFAWFSRLSVADDIVNGAHGWGVVLIVLLSAAVLPALTIGAIGYCVSRGLTKDVSVHWTERARRSYPFQIFLGFGALLLPVVYATGVNYNPSIVLPAPKWLLFCVVLAIGLTACNAVVVRWARLYRDDVGTVRENIQGLGITAFLYLPVLVIFMVMSVNLPAKWNAQAGLVIAAALVAYLWIQFGGWIRLGRMVRILVPADGEMTEDAAGLALRWGRPKPTVWMIRWRKANALAFPFANAIVVTEKLRGVLNREETNSVMAHELAHLCEDGATRCMRLLIPPILILPLFTLTLWMPSGDWRAIVGCYAFILIGFFILRGRRRRMEERADTFGKASESSAGVYPVALAKLYEANLVPAVMPCKRKVHPHLYDRLLAAGITPDYPRPKPPGRWGLLAAFLMIAVNVICLMAVWLLLF